MSHPGNGVERRGPQRQETWSRLPALTTSYACSELGLCARYRSYDIAPGAAGVKKRDTIKSFPPGYRVCVTNPPWLTSYSARRRGVEFVGPEVRQPLQILPGTCACKLRIRSVHSAGDVPQDRAVPRAPRIGRLSARQDLRRDRQSRLHRPVRGAPEKHEGLQRRQVSWHAPGPRVAHAARQQRRRHKIQRSGGADRPVLHRQHAGAVDTVLSRLERSRGG